MNDARYFTHDDNAHHNHQIQALMKKYKVEGYGRFWILIETMRSTKGHKISKKKYVLDSLAEEMKCSTEELKTFIKDCVGEFELFEQDENFFYSESLLERLAKLEHLRKMKQRGAYAMHEKLGHNITAEAKELED